MANFDYKQSYAWNEALELAQSVFTLIESLPETAGVLADQLATSATMLPARVAANLINQEKADLSSLLALVAEIELVNRVYPALDGTDVENRLASLTERLQSPSFTELMPAKQSAAPVEEEEPEEADEPDEEEDEEEEEAEPTHINVQEG